MQPQPLLGETFNRAVQLSGVALDFNVKPEAHPIYNSSLTNPTNLHNAYTYVALQRHYYQRKEFARGTVHKKYVPELSALEYAYSGILKILPKKSLPKNLVELNPSYRSRYLPGTCSDAEDRFHATLQLLREEVLDIEDYHRNRADIVVDEQHAPLFIKKYIDQKTALSLQPMLVRGMFVPAGAIYDLGLDHTNTSKKTNVLDVRVNGYNGFTTFTHAKSSIITATPLRLSMWFHDEAEGRRLFTHQQTDIKNYTNHRQELVDTTIEAFSHAASQSIGLATR